MGDCNDTAMSHFNYLPSAFWFEWARTSVEVPIHVHLLRIDLCSLIETIS